MNQLFHGQRAYATDKGKDGPVYELEFYKHGKGFNVRLLDENGRVMGNEPWRIVQKTMNVFGWVSEGEPK